MTILEIVGTEGKLAYMASAAEELIKMTGADISPASTLLLDDDVNNVQVAVENDIRAVVYRIHDELGSVIIFQKDMIFCLYMCCLGACVCLARFLLV